MEKFLAKLQNQAEENPLVAIGVGVAAFTAITQFVKVGSDLARSRTWSKEVARRSRKLK